MGKNTSDRLTDGEVIELCRALGDDYAAYGLKLPEPAPEPLRESLREGYRAGLARVGRPRAADRFVRKWLQLRYNALTRGRAVSNEVTVDLLRRLDVTACPVTLATLTHGEQKSTDWSVDRLNNDGAYAKGNLAIMSTHANGAKRTKNLAEVRKLSEGDSTVDGLAPEEWSRMAAVMYGPCVFEHPEDQWEMRQVAPVPEGVVRLQWQIFQDYLVRSATALPKEATQYLPFFLKRLPNNQLRSSTKIMVQLIGERAHALASPFDVWFADDLFGRYKVFFEFLWECTDGKPLEVMRGAYQKIPISDRMASEFRFDTRGYLDSSPSDNLEGGGDFGDPFKASGSGTQRIVGPTNTRSSPRRR